MVEGSMVGTSILAMILEADVSDTLVVEISLEWIVYAVADMPR